MSTIQKRHDIANLLRQAETLIEQLPDEPRARKVIGLMKVRSVITLMIAHYSPMDDLESETDAKEKT